MRYMKEHFERMELQQICQFILAGVESMENESLSYHDRLISGSNPIYNRLKEICPIETEFNKASSDLSLALTTYEAVYIEIGMKAGARLIHQLLQVDDCPKEQKAE